MVHGSGIIPRVASDKREIAGSNPAAPTTDDKIIYFFNIYFIGRHSVMY